MKTTKKALVFSLLLMAAKDAILGSFLLFNLSWLLSKAGITYSEDARILSTFFGLSILLICTLCLTAINWVLANKPNGLFLSKFIAWWMIVASVIVFIKIGKPQWAAIDFISGVLVLVPAYLSGRRTGVPTHTSAVQVE